MRLGRSQWPRFLHQFVVPGRHEVCRCTWPRSATRLHAARNLPQLAAVPNEVADLGQRWAPGLASYCLPVALVLVVVSQEVTHCGKVCLSHFGRRLGITGARREAFFRDHTHSQ